MGKGLTGIRSLQRKQEPMGSIGPLLQTTLRGIANKARTDSRHRFRSLYGLVNEQALLSTWTFLNKQATAGVDRVTVHEYASNLKENIADLVRRLKQKRYRAKLVRRRNIPKGDGTGRLRPLGIPVVEDRLLQLTVARILGAIFEPVFLPCSYAYRPGIGAQQAVSDLTQELQFGCYGYIVDVDIKSYFDMIDHDKLMATLEERIDDRPFLRLIRKWLKAGVLEEDGSVLHPETGSPQGGCISPILANIYLHFAVDKWFAEQVKPRCAPRAYMIRYADDIVFAFQYKKDADKFFRVLPKRLGRYGLELSVEKSRILRFKRFKLGKEAERFEFLGFEFRWILDRKGLPRVKRRTSPKRARLSLARLTEWAKRQRTRPVEAVMRTFSDKLRGYYNYYGVRGNAASLWTYHKAALKILHKWLNRRSQSRSYGWGGFYALVEHFRVPRPRITEYRDRQVELLYAS